MFFLEHKVFDIPMVKTSAHPIRGPNRPAHFHLENFWIFEIYLARFPGSLEPQNFFNLGSI
jgi:hypothetical protein